MKHTIPAINTLVCKHTLGFLVAIQQNSITQMFGKVVTGGLEE